MELHWITVLTYTVAFVELCFAIIIYLGSKNYSSKVFVWLVLTHVVWAITLGTLHGFTSVLSTETATFLFAATFFLGLHIAVFLFYFSLTYPDGNRPPYWVLASLLIFSLSQYWVYFAPNTIVGAIYPDPNNFGWHWTYGPYANTFLVPFSLLWAVGLGNLFLKSKKHQDTKTRQHLRFFFWGLLLSMIPSSLFSLTLPYMGIHQFNVFSPAMGLLWVGVVGYSVMKNNQMNLRIVGTELLILGATFLLFISIFI